MVDIDFALITAPLDMRLSDNDRHVLNLIGGWPVQFLNEAVKAGDITLDALCQRTRLTRPHVFYSIARLEDLGFLPVGSIR